jgi:hypothetical protein
MMFCKCTEMTFESIPAGLAQAVFLLDGGDWTTSAVASVVLSCMSTAFTITTIDFDLDTNKWHRGTNPEFYGYIPDTSAGHIMVFMLLFVYHSAHALGNTFSMAVFAQTSWVWLVVYLLADHCGQFGRSLKESEAHREAAITANAGLMVKVTVAPAPVEPSDFDGVVVTAPTASAQFAEHMGSVRGAAGI